MRLSYRSLSPENEAQNGNCCHLVVSKISPSRVFNIHTHKTHKTESIEIFSEIVKWLQNTSVCIKGVRRAMGGLTHLECKQREMQVQSISAS